MGQEGAWYLPGCRRLFDGFHFGENLFSGCNGGTQEGPWYLPGCRRLLRGAAENQ